MSIAVKATASSWGGTLALMMYCQVYASDDSLYKESTQSAKSAHVTKHKAIHTNGYHACCTTNCRCMPEDSLINSDGFNSDPRTFMLHDTVTALGQQSAECSVFMVVGLPLKAVAKASVASFAYQVRHNSYTCTLLCCMSPYDVYNCMVILRAQSSTH